MPWAIFKIGGERHPVPIMCEDLHDARHLALGVLGYELEYIADGTAWAMQNARESKNEKPAAAWPADLNPEEGTE